MHQVLLCADTVVGLVNQAPIPNPPPQPPPGVAELSNTIIGWLKWAAITGGVVGILICSIMIAIGRRNRNQLAHDGLSGAVWVAAGLCLASVASLLVGAFAI
ncbi:hypothetical protein [Pseudonocardia thermophila]|uniref:hypothetical protein n=1 Tax=Pseudonocardia thermophila TaxID=1848 RepID=UPI00248E1185|nr:hypothetical protein [Pseudonocardia thermophila]